MTKYFQEPKLLSGTTVDAMSNEEYLTLFATHTVFYVPEQQQYYIYEKSDEVDNA